MNRFIQSLATMVGMFPATEGKDKLVLMEQLQVWLKGLVFGLAAVAAIYALILGGAWIAQVVVPRLMGA